jgi:hypothetical protein
MVPEVFSARRDSRSSALVVMLLVMRAMVAARRSFPSDGSRTIAGRRHPDPTAFAGQPTLRPASGKLRKFRP